MIHPKPEKRAPRPRKRISRSGAPRRSKRVRRASAKRPSVVKADAAWAKAVREKYGDRCFHWYCSRPATDTHHIIGKKARPKWFKANFRGWYHARWCLLLDADRG